MLYPKEFLNLLNVEIAYHFENSDNSDREICLSCFWWIWGHTTEPFQEALSGYIYHVNAYDLPLKTIDAIKYMNQKGHDMRTLYVVPVDLITLMENNQSLEIVDTRICNR